MPSRPIPAARLWLYRLGAIALGLSVFGVGEAVCRVAGWGAADAHVDPYVAFAGTRPLFVLNRKTDEYEIAANRLDYFSPESFPRKKPAHGRRLFVLGESTVEGEPYNSRTSFTTWLELMLEAQDPSRSWAVVNCGGISYASYRLAPILEECLEYEPDLFVLCIGHNEFLEDRTYTAVKETPQMVAALHRAAMHSRLYSAARSNLLPDSGPTVNRDVLPVEVTARLDFRNGLNAYHHDLDWHTAIARHYGQNLRRMIALARGAGVPVLLVRQPSNLSDCPPFKSEHRPDLSAADRKRFDSFVSQAHESYDRDLTQAVRLLSAAIEIDPRHAVTHYELGTCLLELGRHEDARKAFVAARDTDVCPLRMTSPLEQELVRVSDETRTPLVDLQALFENRSPSGIVGGFWLVDHVHPSIAGHQAVAESLASQLSEMGFVNPISTWKTARDAAWKRHMDTLDAMYFLKGERTLKALQGWTQGKAGK